MRSNPLNGDQPVSSRPAKTGGSGLIMSSQPVFITGTNHHITGYNPWQKNIQGGLQKLERSLLIPCGTTKDFEERWIGVIP